MSEEELMQEMHIIKKQIENRREEAYKRGRDDGKKEALTDLREEIVYYIEEAGWGEETNKALGWCVEFIDRRLGKKEEEICEDGEEW